MNIRYRVELNAAERCELTALLSAGHHPARKLKRAQILLAADAGIADEDAAETIGVGPSTVYRTKSRFVEANLEGARLDSASSSAPIFAGPILPAPRCAAPTCAARPCAAPI